MCTVVYIHNLRLLRTLFRVQILYFVNLLNEISEVTKKF